MLGGNIPGVTRVVSVQIYDHVEAMEYAHADRKSTRLNSSHLVISYAVFCLKKKKTIAYAPEREQEHVLARVGGRLRPESGAAMAIPPPRTCRHSCVVWRVSSADIRAATQA